MKRKSELGKKPTRRVRSKEGRTALDTGIDKDKKDGSVCAYSFFTACSRRSSVYSLILRHVAGSETSSQIRTRAVGLILDDRVLRGSVIFTGLTCGKIGRVSSRGLEARRTESKEKENQPVGRPSSESQLDSTGLAERGIPVTGCCKILESASYYTAEKYYLNSHSIRPHLNREEARRSVVGFDSLQPKHLLSSPSFL